MRLSYERAGFEWSLLGNPPLVTFVVDRFRWPKISGLGGKWRGAVLLLLGESSLCEAEKAEYYSMRIEVFCCGCLLLDGGWFDRSNLIPALSLALGHQLDSTAKNCSGSNTVEKGFKSL